MGDGLANELLYSEIEARQVAVQPSALECEVIRLFDQYREPLLRYTLSFGLRVQDGEEVIQEVFLALFRHLRKGRSRRNLPGWVFTVAHNLALRQRQTNQRFEERLRLDDDGQPVRLRLAAHERALQRSKRRADDDRHRRRRHDQPHRGECSGQCRHQRLRDLR